MFADKSQKAGGIKIYGIICCHRCEYRWIYAGKSDNSTVCPSCKTTVRLHKCLVPVNWDFNLEGELDTQRGIAIPFIEKWNNNYTVKFFIVAEDSTYGKILDFSDLLIFGVVTQEELREGISDAVSGGYPLSDQLKEKLKKQFIQ